MNYIDIHSHHESPAGILAIRNLINPDSAASLVEQEEGYYSIGIHPWHIHPDHWKEDVESLRTLVNHPRVIAIGEAGLDRLVDLPISIQQDVFISMVELSELAQKPLIVHAVRTHAEIAMLHDSLKPKQKWIIHGFNNRQTIADALLSKGICLSFGQAILHHNSPAGNVLEHLRQQDFFLETDDKNISIQEIYSRAAIIRNVTEAELQQEIFNRFKKIFGYAG